MKLQALCRRTTWEIVRDPLNLAFGLGFPLVLLLCSAPSRPMSRWTCSPSTG